MIQRTLIASLALVAFSQPARADKFYVGSEDDAKKTVGNAADGNFIEGVLLKDDTENKVYVIRVLGGEITIAKDLVRKIDKDGLTVAQLEAKEKARAGDLAQANANRRQLQAAEASARREAQAVEASSRRERPRTLQINVDFQGILGQFRTGGRAIRPFDPVINRANLTGLAAIVDDFTRNVMVQNNGRNFGVPASRDLDVQVNLGDELAPQSFRTFDADLTQQDLDRLNDEIHAYVKHQVMLAAHQDPDQERMNLPYRIR